MYLLFTFQFLIFNYLVTGYNITDIDKTFILERRQIVVVLKIACNIVILTRFRVFFPSPGLND